MSRVKRGNKRLLRRKKILKQAKGYYGTKSKAHRIAKLAVERSLQFSYRDRRVAVDFCDNQDSSTFMSPSFPSCE